MSESWIEVRTKHDIDEEDVIRFNHGGRTFAVYHGPDNKLHATDGLRRHEQIHLTDRLL